MVWKAIWPRYRRAVRWLGILTSSLLLILLFSLLYLNQVGLPDFIKNPLLTQLRDRGLDLQFNRLRWSWHRGVVADNINLGHPASPWGPQLFIDQAELRLNHRALRRFHWQVESLVLRGGRLCWTFPDEPGQTPLQGSIDDIGAKLSFLPNDQWELSEFRAVTLGAQLQITGSLTNASWIGRARPKPPASAPSPAWPNTLRRIVVAMRAVHFASPPPVQIVWHGDAREWSRFNAHLRVAIPRARFPSGAVDQLRLAAHGFLAPGTNQLIQIDWDLAADRLQSGRNRFQNVTASGRLLNAFSNAIPDQADWQGGMDHAQSPWGEAQNLKFSAHSIQTTNHQSLVSDLTLSGQNLQSKWGQCGRSQLQLQLTHSLPSSVAAMDSSRERSKLRLLSALAGPQNSTLNTNHSPLALRPSPFIHLLPDQLNGRVQLSQVKTPWGEVKQAQFAAKATPSSAGGNPMPDDAWAYWARLEPIGMDWECQIDGLESPSLQVQELLTAGRWQAPILTVSHLRAGLYGGKLDATAQLDVGTRLLQAQGDFDFDAHKINPLLTPKAQQWLDQYGWEKPPKAHAQTRLILPAWTHAQPDWRTEVLPTFWLDGEVQGGSCSFRSVPMSSAQVHLTLSNAVWYLPKIILHRPEGRLDLTYQENIFTHDFRWQVQGGMDPQALRPLLTPIQQRGLDLFQFTQPPSVTGEVWGRLRAPELLGFQGKVALTNFTFKGETYSDVQGALRFTNQFIQATAFTLHRGQESADVPGVGFDLAAKKVFFTNITAHIDPKVVTRTIGRKTADALAPYQFARPPSVRVNGWVVVPGPAAAEMQFIVSGGPFRYWRFNLPEVHGTINWMSQNLIITNFYGQFYNGAISGDLAADFAPTNGTDLRFDLEVAGADLRPLMRDISPATNRIEGVLSGSLNITRANTIDPLSWQGRGRADLHQGMIWEIPMFGIFSPLLNTIVPGLGNSRADEGSATFAVTHSVISTKDLEIRSLPLRLYYDGTVDFHGRVNARMEASLLRDVWLIGRPLSLAFLPLTKLFEYKVTGTLQQPKTEPLYFPKVLLEFLLFPLHPFRTLKELLPSEETKPPPSAPSPSAKPGAQ